MMSNVRKIGIYIFSVFLLPMCIESAVAADKIAEEEKEFGYFAERTLLSSERIIMDEKLNRKINEIGSRIAEVSENPGLEYRFYVINSPTVNAYSVAGGGVYICTGLLDILESEDEVAGVLAHEIGHIVKSHGIKFYRSSKTKAALWKGLVTGVTGIVGEKLLSASGVTPYTHPYSYDSYSMLTSMGVSYGASVITAPLIKCWINGYGKENEKEADDLAVLYMHKAGYDPQGFLKFLDRLRVMREKLNLSNKKYVSHLMNAEPGLEERMRNIEKLILEIKNNDERNK